MIIMYRWGPYIPRCLRPRVCKTSCCGEFELASEGGQYLVLRPTGDGGYEETARGLYARAAQAYADLAFRHRCGRRAS
ncbi:hypothetical protein [Nonomuraea basaltis]|uniref:hypothetical protein n=1 Tax=Nonomuraea basaltis TaxID=2495887 RepID=UPI00110C3FEA|nr:hypothetical protein [Nonomuraea basaltis]TMR89126.1 hypothetical protein EJK15_62405 [Nonomuraea basaltis]